MRDRKVVVLHSIRALSPEEAVNCTAGTLERAAAKSADKLSLPDAEEHGGKAEHPGTFAEVH